MPEPGFELVPVSLREDTLLAAKRADGRVQVCIRRICENLGVSYSRQLKKLKESAWACVALMTTHDTTGRLQETSVIDLDCLPMWLVTIHPGKVRGAIREKLVAYQLEARDVLARHFLGEPSAPAEPVDPLLAQLSVLVAVRERQLEQERRLAALESRSAAAEAKATAALASVTGDTNFLSVLGYCRLHGLKLGEAEIALAGRRLAARCVREGIEVKVSRSQRWGPVNAYPTAVLDEWRASLGRPDSTPMLPLK